MRVSLFIALVSVWTVPAVAAPVAPSPSVPAAAADRPLEHPIDLSAPDGRRIAPPPGFPQTPLPSDTQDNRWTQPIAIPGLSFGMAGEGTGRFAKHYAILKLEGVTLFGGNVGGSIDGRSAHLVLTWPTEP